MGTEQQYYNSNKQTVSLLSRRMSAQILSKTLTLHEFQLYFDIYFEPPFELWYSVIDLS